MIARRSGRKAPSDKMARLMRTTGKPLIIGVVIGLGAFVVIRFLLFR